MAMLLSTCSQTPSVNFRGGALERESFLRKDKVVVVLGATGSGKSRLAMDLATHFSGEIVNSDKLQVYKGLDILTNKVPDKERRGVPHHLLDFVDQDSDFTARDFCVHATMAINSVLQRGNLPIIAGGSNSYVEAMVEHDGAFGLRVEFCFLWVDMSLPVLHSYVRRRVDEMVEAGMVDEVGRIFDPEADCSKGIRRAIGVSELDHYFRVEDTADDGTKMRLLREAIERTKVNSCSLTLRQLEKIYRLYSTWKPKVHRLDATLAREKSGEEGKKAWTKLVLAPSIKIVGEFVSDQNYSTHICDVQADMVAATN